MTKNQANEILRVVSELSDKELKHLIKEMDLAENTGEYDPGGWIEHVIEKLSIIMGKDFKVYQHWENFLQLLVYRQAAKRFLARKKKEKK